ncbi:hypothetical protein NOX27_24080 [Enterobacter kobei]|uniref:hypothetical protein n=1 Tax=Enterobacteriaceae TaxID=543 RepID=UPI002109EF50|nr:MULTISPECIES: hypothetical protein [Enterobacteriaceae]MCQ4359381.1 hypothetical protein [Enterobacter kobei]MDC3552180.1 hypothetical protein [Escherichia coli]HDC4314673.1 hypothetical protein [Enterobacter kobei]HDC4328002.1 hypothetical protein [Enterobacter kobei]HDC4598583.1 hypothetical protein [Enterobacter kobei]
MAKGMGDLTKRVTPPTAPEAQQQESQPVTPAAPLRNPVKPQGRPTRGKSKIQSRTMSMEDEYIELIDMLAVIPRFDKFTRSDVIRAAIFQLSEKTPAEIEEAIKLNIEAVNASDVSFRTEEIKRKLMGKG